jgi:hypothetical protein
MVSVSSSELEGREFRVDSQALGMAKVQALVLKQEFEWWTKYGCRMNRKAKSFECAESWLELKGAKDDVANLYLAAYEQIGQEQIALRIFLAQEAIKEEHEANPPEKKVSPGTGEYRQFKLGGFLNVDQKRICDLLCNAFEGGVNWCVILDNRQPTEEVMIPVEWKKYPHISYCWGDGAVLLGDSDAYWGGGEDESTLEDSEKWELTEEKIIKGLMVMADKYSRHFSDFMNDNQDAETGDVFLQCALFGDIVF